VWEMFYCESAYEGLMEAQICVGVCDGSLRPQFNDTCPLPYQKLAKQCWAQNPEDRYCFWNGSPPSVGVLFSTAVDFLSTELLPRCSP